MKQIAPKDRIVWITGASSGIGAAAARAFAADGATLVLGARRIDRLGQVAEQCQRLGARKVVALPLDVCNLDSIHRFRDQGLQQAGGATVLVNNAGGAKGLDPVAQADDDDWQFMLNANVLGLLRMTRALIPALIKSEDGHIIMIGSIAGHEAYEKGSAYCGAKAAVLSIRKSLRLELCGQPVRVSTVDPGMTESEFSLVRFKGDEDRAAAVYKGLKPLAADDVANIIHFVVSCPPHVNIDELIVTPRAQASPFKAHRD